MNMAKRFSSVFLAFALCAAMSLGSLSFMPKSFAVADYKFPFSESEVPPTFGNSVSLVFHNIGNGYGSNAYFYLVLSYPYSFTVTYMHISNQYAITFKPSRGNYGTLTILAWDSVSSHWSTSSRNINSNSEVTLFPYTDGIGNPYPVSSTGGGSFTTYGTIDNSFSYSFIVPPYNKPSFWDYSPFFFPEMPHGYFDGNINVVDGTYNIDFPSNASISGAITQTGNDHYTWSWNHGNLYWNGETVQGEHEGWISPDYQLQTPPNGDITQTAYANRLINLSLSDLDSVVNYTPAYNENSRFRCWSCVMDSSYVWFISDTRNKITGSIVSVTSDEVSWKYEFSDPQGGNTIYPTWAIVFSPMGEVIQVLSPTTVSNKNTYTLSCSIGTLEQDQDTGIWSCDPLYHGFWFSDDSPPVVNITLLHVAENKKYLANPVFGDSAFQLQFLDSINRGISDINSNIQSLQSAMQSSISGQTSDFQNMDAPSAPQPSTSQMMDYFSKESAFSAPNTDELFSGDIKSGHYWDGVTWWSTKFNDIIVSNQVIVAFTTAMLTLGLAVLIIGRRFSMR